MHYFFKKKKKIYLLQKNIIIKKLNNKLDFKKLGPYKIIRKINKINYKLILLIYRGRLIYFIFYILLLKKAN